MNLKKKDLGKKTYEYEVIIPKETIKKEYDHAFEHILKDFETEGFRKGNVPKDVAEKKIPKENVYQHMIEHLIQDEYTKVLQSENLKPIITPKIDLISAKENEDWVVKMTISEKPEVKLPDYKKEIENIKKEMKKEDIWTPGKDKNDIKPQEQKPEEKKNQILNKIFDFLLKKSTVEISDLIIESEINNKLTQLVDDVRKIGMTIEAYLKTKNETMDSIKAKYTKEITEMYKMEFILEKIAEDEKIIVEDKDLEVLFGNIKDEKQKEDAKRNAYFYASLLKRQKTLDYLYGL